MYSSYFILIYRRTSINVLWNMLDSIRRRWLAWVLSIWVLICRMLLRFAAKSY